MARYAEIYGAWKADPESFWMEAAKTVDWIKPPTRRWTTPMRPSIAGSSMAR